MVAMAAAIDFDDPNAIQGKDLRGMLSSLEHFLAPYQRLMARAEQRKRA